MGGLALSFEVVWRPQLPAEVHYAKEEGAAALLFLGDVRPADPGTGRRLLETARFWNNIRRGFFAAQSRNMEELATLYRTVGLLGFEHEPRPGFDTPSDAFRAAGLEPPAGEDDNPDRWIIVSAQEIVDYLEPFRDLTALWDNLRAQKQPSSLADITFGGTHPRVFSLGDHEDEDREERELAGLIHVDRKGHVRGVVERIGDDEDEHWVIQPPTDYDAVASAWRALSVRFRQLARDVTIVLGNGPQLSVRPRGARGAALLHWLSTAFVPPRRCASADCDNLVPPGRRLYCSARCKNREKMRRRRARQR